MWLGRKISRAKWDHGEEFDSTTVPGDAVGDIRTTGNTLSWWDCGDGDEPKLECLVVALSGDQERLDKFDCTWVKASDLTSKGLVLSQTAGRTIAPELMDRHYDLVGLDGFRLLETALILDAALRQERFKRFAKAEVKSVLQGAINAGQIKRSDLQQALQPQLADPPVA